jgi:hypothetical protein
MDDWKIILIAVFGVLGTITLAAVGVCCYCGKCRCCCKKSNTDDTSMLPDNEPTSTIPQTTTPPNRVKLLFEKKELGPKDYNEYSQGTNCYAFALKQHATIKPNPGTFADLEQFERDRLTDNSIANTSYIFPRLHSDCQRLNFEVIETNNFQEELEDDDINKWMIAFSVQPNQDCHWWRRKSLPNGEKKWIHKPGARNIRAYAWNDASLTINDPRESSGVYTCFGAFYIISRKVTD